MLYKMLNCTSMNPTNVSKENKTFFNPSDILQIIKKMHFKTLLTPNLSEVLIDEKHALVKHFYIKRVPLQPGYDVLLQEEERRFHVDTDFSALFQKLTLRSLDTHSYNLPICYRCWGSRKIHVGFVNLEQAQGKHWEEMQKKRTKIWKDLGKEEYEWEKHLLWKTQRCRSIRRQNYKLVDQNTTETIAEFQSDKDLYMGGVLAIKNIGEDSESFDLKVLMAFMAIFEKKRSRAHHTVYRPSKGNIMRSIYYKILQFGFRYVGVMLWQGLDPVIVQETSMNACCED